MSISTMARVWKNSTHNGTELVMLLAIADFADDHGYAYPSVGTLARKCRMGPRNAHYILKALEKSGELSVLRGQGPRGTNRYRVNVNPVQDAAPLQGSAHPISAPICSTLHGAGAMDCAKPLQDIADKPSGAVREPSRRKSPPLPSTRPAKKFGQTFCEFLESCRSSEALAISADDPIYPYAQKVGISDDMLRACWGCFAAYYGAAGNGAGKRYKDWRATFRNSVKGNWYKLWFLKGESDQAQWTTSGEQKRREMAVDADAHGETP